MLYISEDMLPQNLLHVLPTFASGGSFACMRAVCVLSIASLLAYSDRGT